MWHEARKQERRIRCMMVDYRKRADRRRDYYEQIKSDPTQFLRVYGRPAKIHLDPAVAAAADGPQIMQPWQGNSDVLIDRYDVRSNIDHIPDVRPSSKSEQEMVEESKCNYESYRILVQNECAGVTETQCLHQIFVDEQFGSLESLAAAGSGSTGGGKEDKNRKGGAGGKKAAIGYQYEDSTAPTSGGGGEGAGGIKPPVGEVDGEEDEESSDEEIDLDNILDIEMLTEEQEAVLNTLSLEFGMHGATYSEFLQYDREELDALKEARQLEEEKAQFSGRKSRRERRAFKEKRMKNKQLSPPSYAMQDSSSKLFASRRKKNLSSSRSRSKSPVARGVVQFITSFGGESDGEGVIHGPALPTPSQLQAATRSKDRSSHKQHSPTPSNKHRSLHSSPPPSTDDLAIKNRSKPSLEDSNGGQVEREEAEGRVRDAKGGRRESVGERGERRKEGARKESTERRESPRRGSTNSRGEGGRGGGEGRRGSPSGCRAARSYRRSRSGSQPDWRSSGSQPDWRRGERERNERRTERYDARSDRRHCDDGRDRERYDDRGDRGRVESRRDRSRNESRGDTGSRYDNRGDRGRYEGARGGGDRYGDERRGNGRITELWGERPGRYPLRAPSPQRRSRRSRSRSRTRTNVKSTPRSRSRQRSGSGSKQRSRKRSRSVRKSGSRRRSSRSGSSSSSSGSSSGTSRGGRRSLSPPPIKSYRRASLASSGASLDSDTEAPPAGTPVGAGGVAGGGAMGAGAMKDAMSSSSLASRLEQGGKPAPAGAASQLGNTVEHVTASKSKLTPQERLKRKMAVALIKQCKADKRAQAEKLEREEQLKLDREEELRCIAAQQRQRERERRHRERDELEQDDRARLRRLSRSRSGSRTRSTKRSDNSRRSPSSEAREPPAKKLVDY